MADELSKIARQLVAGMTPEEQRSLLHELLTGTGPIFGRDPSADLFATPEPEVRPVPEVTRGFRVRLDLTGTKPPVWRRLELPGDIRLDRLHRVIQAAMGWLDCHLHRFVTGPDPRSPYFLTRYDIEEEGEEGIDEAEVRLDQVVAGQGDRLWYEYDFGDGWRHVLAVEAVLDDPPDKPMIVTGKRACPPEDCGGVWGYGELAAWVRGNDDDSAVPESFESAAEVRAWLPDGWHPDHFDVGETQESLDWAAAPEIPLPNELMLTKLGLDMEGHGLLDELVRKAAALDDASAEGPDTDLCAAAIAPFITLLEVLGDGVKLTAAGYLPPATVTELAIRTGVADWWIGKMNREDQTYPIHRLRAAARALGLVSVRQGVLSPTAAARRYRDDPTALVRHIASRLPIGRTKFDRQAGWVTLAVVAAGTESGQWGDTVRRILTDIGWRSTVDDRPVLLQVANPTLDVFDVISGRHLRREADAALSVTAQIARTAIFHRPEPD